MAPFLANHDYSGLSSAAELLTRLRATPTRAHGVALA